MTQECSYCNEPVPDEEYLDHLRATHDDELSAIDRRRVDEELGTKRSRDANLTRYALGVGALTLFVLAYVAIFTGALSSDGFFGTDDSSAAILPDADDRVHYHGTIEVIVDGEPIDFSQPEYIAQHGCFHFHNDDAVDDGVWHVHCENVSLEFALETLGIDATADSVEINGEMYADDDPDTSVSITVDGEPVDPETYVLEGVGPVDQAQQGAGDNVRIVVESE
ncbi:hypothetical protein ACYJ1Y_11335 [Natrialbaceae archaeon A-gly3]